MVKYEKIKMMNGKDEVREVANNNYLIDEEKQLDGMHKFCFYCYLFLEAFFFFLFYNTLLCDKWKRLLFCRFDDEKKAE